MLNLHSNITPDVRQETAIGIDKKAKVLFLYFLWILPWFLAAIPVTIPSTVTSIGSNAFYKAKTWTSFNYYMTKIVNKTNRAFDWRSITGGPSTANFVTGTVENWYGDIEVVRG